MVNGFVKKLQTVMDVDRALGSDLSLFKCKEIEKKRPNQGVQLTPLARFVGWARFIRQSATACWQPDIPQPPTVAGNATFLALQESAARALPGTCLSPLSSTLHTPASGAADACPLGGPSESLNSSHVIVVECVDSVDEKLNS